MKNIFLLTKKELKEYLNDIGEKDYRCNQIIKWIIKDQINDFDLMTNISLKLRNRLKYDFFLNRPKLNEIIYSKDGTGKAVIKLSDGYFIETALIPYTDRITVCVSTQIGCRYGCKFCLSGKIKLKRNLTAFEIAEQVNIWKNEGYKITNIVMMGVGEPMDNYDNVVDAYDIFLDSSIYGYGKRKVTVSSVGIIPELEKLIKRYNKIKIAISLHSADQKKREKIIPISKKYTLKNLKKYLKENQFKYAVTLQYLILNGFNTEKTDIDKLVNFCKGLKVKINLIPYNNTGYLKVTSKHKSASDIAEILYKKGIEVSVRKSRGRDIKAACGQLLGEKIL